MKRTAKNLITIARAEIGYHEKASNSSLDNKTANAGRNNYQKYGRDLHNAGYYNGNKNGYAWCDQFVDWCFWTLCDHNKVEAEKMECQSGPYGAGVEYSAQYYKNQGRLDSYPRVGDQAFFGKRQHTGIVSAVNGNRVTVIEGNKNDCVSENTYVIGQWLSNEFGHPYYEEDSGNWKQDTHGWYYEENGIKIKNRWVEDSGGWCYIGPDGYMVTDKWAKDSKHWYYMDKTGHFTKNKWVKDSKDWCYLDNDGWLTTNAWVKDSGGWCVVKDDGHLLRDGWASDNNGKHYMDKTGHMKK